MRGVMAFLAVALLAAPANAVSIRNFTDEPQTLTIEQGRATQEITLPPRGVYRYNGGGIWLQREGRPRLYADFYDEFAIWPDGTMRIQRRIKSKGGSR